MLVVYDITEIKECLRITLEQFKYMPYTIKDKLTDRFIKELRECKEPPEWMNDSELGENHD